MIRVIREKFGFMICPWLSDGGVGFDPYLDLEGHIKIKVADLLIGNNVDLEVTFKIRSNPNSPIDIKEKSFNSWYFTFPIKFETFE